MDRDCKRRSANSSFAMDRRTVLAGAASLPLLRSSFVLAQVPATPFSDAHSHFFNGSDLPVAGFAKYDLMPEWLGDNPAVAALVDLLAYMIKPRAKTAAWEARHLGEPEEWSYLAFAREAANFVLGRTKSAPAKALTEQGINQAALKSSYDALRTALIADAGYSVALAPQMLGGANELAMTETIFAEAAKKADQQGEWGPGDVADFNVTTNTQSFAPDVASAFGAVARSFGWGYLMIKRRETHLKEYVERNGAAGFAPDILVNHLVDYDLWVNDHPADPGSSQLDQIDFWSALAAKAKSWPQPVDVRTFAGFCPLKLAIQTRARHRRTFDDFKQLRKDGKIAGFKLYPPMGFRPIGNAQLQDSDFDPGGLLRVSALDQWHKVAGQSERLGPKLDEALAKFYDYCAAERVPIMAHARRSNGTAKTYEERADPHIWKQVVDRPEWPLRLQLGHLITGAQTFVDSGGRNDDAWQLDATLSMLTNPNFDSGPQVYGDLGYMPDLLRNRILTGKFFLTLKLVFGQVGLKRICYGTDWIMLEREKHQREYLSALVTGMNDAGFTPEERADILENNVRRFLGN